MRAIEIIPAQPISDINNTSNKSPSEPMSRNIRHTQSLALQPATAIVF